MSDLQNILSLSASGMKAQANRLRHVSENIANADTPGYHRKTVSFEEVVEQGAKTGAVNTGDVQLDQTKLTRVYDPGHPMAGEDGFYDGSNVELMIEIADAREAQRSYEANLKMFDQARQMSSSLLELLRR
ncbi:MAG: flagellar basal body rod protein FlgC [Alphaproteobacteria bacterium]|uniref:Flagellar basal body rod protein FlgB n=1 Tax=Celeribacter baekdonensis TaxID=875171 RepID=A0A1G7KY73_9RHOB|nr:flagellar basal body rod protein FlgC [Celeribacter baekdonensis]MBU0642735.1 flagellar basal body rod protein FlgC [Alphaproteobacteria bacterium]MBU1277691.1 flagellar basal body rod protein FlgC [Alphaproteobacteria bacterium]MBU1574248.1 flagellar basal body rod protein FlgC [Alphaproteobacteria bacterium]MBU1827459.1 flagellar basal body rod protein FlgC [Alphaproteobacteria bacterium]MBU2077095.1 flagellar basal body rod protein FlgC [Alphaproteobacteria bacterium]|tara:strand:+ start:195 stop:587 length:393 start_codon:yes stop_codon:yes gene_type:complete